MNIRYLSLFFLWLCCCFGAPVTMRSDELDDLNIALRRSAETLASKMQEQTNVVLQMAAELEGAVMQGDSDRARKLAQQLAQQPAATEEMKNHAARLARELPRLIDARRDAFIAGTDALVERARRECQSAKIESDLLDLWRELSALKLRQPMRTDPADVSRSMRRLDAATRTTEAWMDFLVAKSQGNLEKAKEVLSRAKNDTASYPILPREEYDRRLAEVSISTDDSARVSALLARIKSIEDTEAVGREIDDALKPPKDRTFPDAFIVQLFFNEYRSAVAAYLSGDIGEAWQRANASAAIAPGPWFGQTIRLRTMLLNELVPRVLKLPPGAERRPDETSANHLRRLLADAAAKGQWDEVLRIAQARSMMGYEARGANPMSDLANAVGAFLEGQRFEAAADFPGAILAYERVLRSTAEMAPVREASERLKALRQSRPTAFAEAHPRLESDRFTQLFDQLDRSIKTMENRLSVFEKERIAARQARPQPATPAPSVDLTLIEERLTALETGAVQKKPDEERLDRLELLLGPGAEALARRAPERHQFRIWLGPDFTVYRSALPQSLEKNLTWEISYNGRSVLNRNASGEFFYRYHHLKPGNYSITLHTGDRTTPESNVVEFTITPEVAAKLPKTNDNDLDRDGLSNEEEGEEQ